MDDAKRVLGRVLAVELTELELDGVAGAGPYEEYTLYDTNGGSDNTQLRDGRG